jgi:hypothetical protein
MREFLATPQGYLVMQSIAVAFAAAIIWRGIMSNTKKN